MILQYLFAYIIPGVAIVVCYIIVANRINRRYQIRQQMIAAAGHVPSPAGKEQLIRLFFLRMNPKEISEPGRLKVGSAALRSQISVLTIFLSSYGVTQRFLFLISFSERLHICIRGYSLKSCNI